MHEQSINVSFFQADQTSLNNSTFASKINTVEVLVIHTIINTEVLVIYTKLHCRSLHKIFLPPHPPPPPTFAV